MKNHWNIEFCPLIRHGFNAKYINIELQLLHLIFPSMLLACLGFQIAKNKDFWHHLKYSQEMDHSFNQFENYKPPILDLI